MKTFNLQYEQIRNKHYIATILTDNPEEELIKVASLINPKRIKALDAKIREGRP